MAVIGNLMGKKVFYDIRNVKCLERGVTSDLIELDTRTIMEII